MTRRIKQVNYALDSKGIEELPAEELKAILRAADDLIMSGGRTLLAKVLKGSKDKKVLEHGLDKNPSYGYFSGLSLEKVQAKIDWVIENDYLDIEYSGRLPMLIYTSDGWNIEKDIYSDELLKGFDKMLESGAEYFNMEYLKDRNRDLIMLLLDKVEATNDEKYFPILESWGKIDYRKIRERIDDVITAIKAKKGKPVKAAEEIIYKPRLSDIDEEPEENPTYNGKVDIEELIDHFEFYDETANHYINLNTGKMYHIPSEVEDYVAKKRNEDLLADWEKEYIPAAKDILDNPDNYIEIPGSYYINDYPIMENFCFSVKDQRKKRILIEDIQGKGAFGRFRDDINKFGLVDDWNNYRQKAYKKIVIEWCIENEI